MGVCLTSLSCCIAIWLAGFVAIFILVTIGAGIAIASLIAGLAGADYFTGAIVTRTMAVTITGGGTSRQTGTVVIVVLVTAVALTNSYPAVIFAMSVGAANFGGTVGLANAVAIIILVAGSTFGTRPIGIFGIAFVTGTGINQNAATTAVTVTNVIYTTGTWCTIRAGIAGETLIATGTGKAILTFITCCTFKMTATSTAPIYITGTVAVTGIVSAAGTSF